MKYFGEISYTIDKEHVDVNELENWKEDDILTLSNTYDFSDEEYSEEEAIAYIENDLKLVANAGNEGNHIHNVSFNISKIKFTNAIVMNYTEFEELIGKVSGGHAGIGCDIDGWFYTEDDEYNTEDINKDLSNHLGVNVKAVRIDTTADEDDVVIICE